MSNQSLTLDHFLTVGLVAEELYPGIFVVDNFITPEEISALEAQIERMTQEDWEKTYTESLYNFINDQYGVETVEEARALGYNVEIDQGWVDKNALIDESISYPINLRLDRLFSLFPNLFLNGVGAMQRQYEGVSLAYHIDSLSNPSVVFANVIYVNDDFTGGELHFPNIDITYRPKKGSLIVFPSSEEYLHGVLPVGPGPTRYALPAFVNRIEE